jgi:hypothetical protein
LVAEGALPFALTPDSPDTLIGLFGAQAVSQPLSDSAIIDEVQQSFLAPESDAPAKAVPAELPPVAEHQELLAQPRPEEPAVQSTVAADLLAVSAVDDSGDTTDTVIEEPLAAQQPVPVGSSGFALDMYSDFSSKLASLLSGGALSEEEIATRLCIEKSQTKAWLKRASEAGLVAKLKKPVRYSLAESQGSLC